MGVGTSTFISKEVADATPAVKIEDLVESKAVSEKLTALVVGSKASMAGFMDPEGISCEKTVSSFIKVTEPTIDPVAADISSAAAKVASPAKSLVLASTKIIKGLPEAGFGQDTGSPCTKNLECASGVCPATCVESTKSKGKPWKNAKSR